MEMRILFVNDSGVHVGGAETYLLALSKLLKKEGHEVFLFSISGERGLKTKSEFVFHDVKKGRVVHHIEHYYFKHDLFTSLEKYIIEVGPDVIHLQNTHKYTNTVLKAAVVSKVPVVKTVHDIELVCPTGLCYKPNRELCEGGFGLKCLTCGCLSSKRFTREIMPQYIRRMLLSKVLVFVTMSRAFEGKLKENGISRVIRVNHFVDAQRFTPASRHPQNAILYAGMLTPIKGVDVLIRAMPFIVKRIPKAKLTVAGDGPERPKLTAMARELGVSGSVRFMGKIPYEKMPAVYRNASVLAVPSTGFEQFSLSGLEGMACGLPVVASAVGGIPEWLEDGKTGFLCKPFDPEDLAVKISLVLADRKRGAQMGRRGREKAAVKYSPEAHVKKILEIYASVRR
jgi:glycosyltransferase involved in cell wall biosynthesis